MKVKKQLKFGFLIVLFLLLGIKSVSSIGVGQPMPVGFKLLRGGEGRFFFRVSVGDSSTDLTCTYSVSGLDALVVTFDEEQVFIEAGGNEIVYGTISVPGDAPIQSYTGNLKVSCEPKVESGSAIKPSMTVPFELSVVSTLEEVTIPPLPEEEKPTISTSVIFAIIIIVVLVIGVGYWFSKKRKKKI